LTLTKNRNTHACMHETSQLPAVKHTAPNCWQWTREGHHRSNRVASAAVVSCRLLRLRFYLTCMSCLLESRRHSHTTAVQKRNM
jgi:hypothetical protein